MAMIVAESPRWPERLKEILGELGESTDQSSLDEIRGQAWRILNTAISLYLELHSARYGKISNEDLEDIAAEKSLDVLRDIDCGSRDFSRNSPAQITRFVSNVARNGLIDFYRSASRRAEPRGEDRPESDLLEGCQGVAAASSPDALVEGKEFARALRGCAEELSPRSRLVWFLRVFCEMPSLDIAVHPKVHVKASHVDVIVQRARQAIRDCMRRHDFEPGEMPPGSFFEIWQAFQPDLSLASTGVTA